MYEVKIKVESEFTYIATEIYRADQVQVGTGNASKYVVFHAIGFVNQNQEVEDPFGHHIYLVDKKHIVSIKRLQALPDEALGDIVTIENTSYIPIHDDTEAILKVIE